jgi:hypothetical protein
MWPVGTLTAGQYVDAAITTATGFNQFGTGSGPGANGVFDVDFEQQKQFS